MFSQTIGLWKLVGLKLVFTTNVKGYIQKKLSPAIASSSTQLFSGYWEARLHPPLHLSQTSQRKLNSISGGILRVYELSHLWVWYVWCGSGWVGLRCSAGDSGVLWKWYTHILMRKPMSWMEASTRTLLGWYLRELAINLESATRDSD